jgi:hypothetical protein
VEDSVFSLRWLRRPTPRPTPSAATTVRLDGPEQLEGRDLPSGLSFSFTLADPNQEFAPYPLLLPNLQAAGKILSGFLDGKGTLRVLVRANDSVARAGGADAAVNFVGMQGGLAVVEEGALTFARTGVHVNGAGPDIILDLNARDYLPRVWFDPSGGLRLGAVPPDKTDFISVALHEMTHALGFQGYRDISGTDYGTIPGGVESTFDALSAFGPGGILYFEGLQAMAVYGNQPVPLTSVGASTALESENFYHFGNPGAHPGAELVPDLMNGVVFQPGVRYAVSALDLAALSDLGWKLARGNAHQQVPSARHR